MLLKALRAKRTSHIVAACNASLVALVVFGVPVTPEQMAAALSVVTALLLLVLGAPKPGEDGDPETPL